MYTNYITMMIMGLINLHLGTTRTQTLADTAGPKEGQQASSGFVRSSYDRENFLKCIKIHNAIRISYFGEGLFF
jgi:hypothetical protein